jgi:hypothetical protein
MALGGAMGGAKAFLEGVERAGSDIAKDNADSGDDQTPRGGVRGIFHGSIETISRSLRLASRKTNRFASIFSPNVCEVS